MFVWQVSLLRFRKAARLSNHKPLDGSGNKKKDFLNL